MIFRLNRKVKENREPLILINAYSFSFKKTQERTHNFKVTEKKEPKDGCY